MKMLEDRFSERLGLPKADVVTTNDYLRRFKLKHQRPTIIINDSFLDNLDEESIQYLIARKVAESTYRARAIHPVAAFGISILLLALLTLFDATVYRISNNFLFNLVASIIGFLPFSLSFYNPKLGHIDQATLNQYLASIAFTLKLNKEAAIRTEKYRLLHQEGSFGMNRQLSMIEESLRTDFEIKDHPKLNAVLQENLAKLKESQFT
jgi:hypothetical protein